MVFVHLVRKYRTLEAWPQNCPRSTAAGYSPASNSPAPQTQDDPRIPIPWTPRIMATPSAPCPPSPPLSSCHPSLAHPGSLSAHTQFPTVPSTLLQEASSQTLPSRMPSTWAIEMCALTLKPMGLGDHTEQFRKGDPLLR